LDKHTKDDAYFMIQALQEAYKALWFREIPIGAVVVQNNIIIAKGFNRCITFSDPTAHAEIVALRKTAKKLKNYRLNNCSVYVTIEPCMMCIGALVNARIKKLVFGAYSIKNGACESIFRIANSKKLNHKIEIVGGEKTCLNIKCAKLIQDFFKKKR
jgi:tRNA(adenine34) deaminase